MTGHLNPREEVKNDITPFLNPCSSVQAFWTRREDIERDMMRRNGSASELGARVSLSTSLLGCRSRVGHQHQPREGSYVRYVADRSHPEVVRRHGRCEFFQIAPGG